MSIVSSCGESRETPASCSAGRNALGLFVVVSAVSLAALACASGSPASIPFVPLRVSLAPGIATSPGDVPVYGISANALYGINEKTVGLEVGALNETGASLIGLGAGGVNVVRKDAIGLQLGVGSVTSGSLKGLQAGAANQIEGDLLGVQIGVGNAAHAGSGLQLGLVNQTESLRGLQLGLLNFNEGGFLPFFPLVNFGL